MKAVLLVIELKRDVALCADDIDFLMSRAPALCEKVIFGSRMLGLLMPAHSILPVMHVPLRNALSVFQNYWLVGLSGEVLAKNGSLDPLADGIKKYVVSPPPVRRREGAKS